MSFSRERRPSHDTTLIEVGDYVGVRSRSRLGSDSWYWHRDVNRLRGDVATIDTGWQELAAVVEGDVVLPGSPRYDEVRKPPIPRFHDVRPQAIVLCRTPADVAEAIAFARRSGIGVSVRSGGHEFAGRSSGPGIVLDLTAMHSLEVA